MRTKTVEVLKYPRNLFTRQEVLKQKDYFKSKYWKYSSSKNNHYLSLHIPVTKMKEVKQ